VHRILAALLLATTVAASSASTFTFANEPGPYRVGLHVKAQYDFSRVYKGRTDLVTGEPTKGERARPIQALVWYPAQDKGQALVYRDYLATIATEEQPTLGADEVRRATDALLAGWLGGPRGDLVRQELKRPMWARRDAPEHAGKFPVVIYAPSFSAPAVENVDLCEYLASQGYVVIASPSFGARTRSMTADLEGAEAQAADIEFLIGYAHSLPQADMAHVAVIGFSWGGLANVLAAAKDERIGALVSLDGSMRSYPGYVNGGKDAAKYVTAARVTVPLLYMAQHRYSVEDLEKRKFDTTFSLMNQMKYSDVYLVTMNPMQHMDFSSYALRVASDASYDEYSRDEASLAHSWTARYVHRFLDAYLKNDGPARAFLANAPAKNKVPAHMMTLDVRHGSGAPPTLATFVSTLAAGGFEHAIDVYQKLHAEDAGFSLDDSSLNTWGYALMRNGRPNQAIEIFKLATHLFPERWNPFDSLAEAYEQAGQRELAIKNYRRSLELEPKNDHAVERLQALAEANGTGIVKAAK
jgi:dienelactone hydrolase